MSDAPPSSQTDPPRRLVGSGGVSSTIGKNVALRIFWLGSAREEFVSFHNMGSTDDDVEVPLVELEETIATYREHFGRASQEER